MKKRMGESGNIFFTLFGAVALVGVVGAATSTLMRGPVGTVVALNQRAKADSQMQIAMKLAMLEAQNNSNDCDLDTFIEPVGAGAPIAGLTGGGRLPQVGSTTNDPWGSPYGYCGWNHGMNTTSTCSGGATPLLRGHTSGQGTVIAVLSAGPDRTFGSTCVDNPGVGPYITRGANGADDLIVSMTYSEANEASGGLWSISSTDPDAITTNRSLDVSTGAQFSSGDVGFTNTRATFGTGSTLDFTGGGLFMLPNECQSASCGNPNKGLMRRFTNGTCPAEGTQEVLQICDGAGWLDIGGAGAIVAAAGNPGEIQYNAAGLMGASSSLIFNSSNGLTVGGDSIFSADLRVNQTMRATTLNVSGNSILTGTLDVNGAADFNSTIDVALGATFGSWLRGSDGTSTAPTYSFTSDNDSGMFFSSSALRFSVDGTERMAVSAGGVTMTAGQTVGNFTVGGTLTTNDLSVTNNITANRFISRMASTSVAAPGFETEPGTGMYSAVDNTLTLVTGGTSRIVIDGTGDVGIGVLSPDAKLDVGGEIKVGTSNVSCGPTLHGAIRYVSGDLLQVCSSVTSIWEDIGTSGGGGGGAASYWTRISSVDRRLYYDDAFVGVGTNNPLDDFHVAGDLLATGAYSGTASIGASGAGSRMFFDPESGSFRAGVVSGAQWDNGNVGIHSFAVGENAQASGAYARALGNDVVASGAGSLAIGQFAQATNLGSAALGLDVISSGIRSAIWGLGDATGALPIVSGTESHVTIMGDQSGVNMTANQTWALLGGRMLIDQTPAVNPAVSGTLSLDVEGGVGAMQYCDENGVNCFTAASVATGGVTAPGNNRELIYNSGGVLGANPNMSFSSAGNLTLGGTGAIALPSGDGTNRPVASANGMLRYNTALGRFEGYQGGQWRDLITGTALAAGANTQIQFNSGGYFGAVPAFTFAQGEMHVDGTDYGRGGVLRIRGAETPAANYLDATMILESTASGSIWSQTLASNNPARNGDFVFAHYNGSVWTEPLILADDGRIGIFSTHPRASLDINTTDAILLPVGNIGNRPSVPVDGMIRYNSQSGKFEGHQGGTWQDILTSAVVGGAAAPERGIQFNSGGNFAATSDFQYTSGGSFLLTGAFTNTRDASLPTGAGVRMFFDPAKAALRAGRVSGTQWDNNIGPYSVALGYDTTASGSYSTAFGVGSTASGLYSMATGYGTTASGDYSFTAGAMGQALGNNATAMGWSNVASGISSVAMGRLVVAGSGVAGDGFGDGSMAIGLVDDAIAVPSRPQVRGSQSLGIFMDNQSGRIMTSSNTMGLFGGQFVIDPRVPAQQLSARGVIDVGAATDAIVLPRGTTAQQPVGVNGMIRYNSQNGKFEGFQQGSWQDILTGAAGAAGANTQIQYNSNGSLWASPSFTWNGTTNTLNVQGPATFGTANITDGSITTAGILNIVPNGAGQSKLIMNNVSDGNSLGIEFINTGTNSTDWEIFVAGNNFTGSNGADPQEGNFTIIDKTMNEIRLIVSKNTGNVAIGGDTPQAKLDVQGSGAVLLPRGITGNRPAGIDGMIRYNSQSNRFEGHQAGAWQDLVTIGTTPGASAPNRGIQFNSGGSFAAVPDFVYSSTGNLGVGTATPTQKLDVAGNIAIPATGVIYSGAKPMLSANEALGNMMLTVNVYGDIAHNATGTNNTLLGYGTGETLTTGTGNTLVGTAAGYNSTTYDSNTLVGNNAGTYVAGSYNAVLGARALQYANTGVAETVYLGYAAGGGSGADSAGGLRTVAIGAYAGMMADGANNIFMGYDTGGAASTGANNILIGTSLQLPTAATNNYLNIGGLLTGTTNAGLLAVNGTGALTVPRGTTGNRPAGIDGMIRYNSQSGKFEGHQGGTWQDILTSAVSGGAASPNRGIQFNSNGSFAASTNFTFTSGGSFLLSGTYAGTSDSSLPTGAGTRMFFDPAKSAFRAGTVTGGQWSFASTGLYSTAFGHDIVASGEYSTAMGGGDTAASGNYSTAMGQNAQASGWASTVMGGDTVASGDHSTAMGYGNIASGEYSTAMGTGTIASGIGSTAIGRAVTAGNGTAGSGLGDGSMALGLIDDAVTITTRSQVTGIQSYGIFMGAQDGLVMSANNTMGLFGGQLVIDPRIPAQQLSARGVIDVGAATDAIVLPRGTTAQQPAGVNGMLRYNSQTGRFEGYQSGAWQDILTSGVSGGAASPNRGIQFNSGGNFAASADFVYTSTGTIQLSTADYIPLSMVGTSDAWVQLTGVSGRAGVIFKPQDSDALGWNITSDATNGLLFKQTTNANSGTNIIRMGQDGIVRFTNTNAIQITAGDTSQRPTSSVNGMLRYNSQTGKFEGYQGGSWQDIVTGAATSTFLSLSDTPASYAGQANKFVRVNAGTTALEFTDEIVPSVAGQPAPTGTILDDLGDVTIALPTAGQILTYSGGQWVNGVAGGGSAAGTNTQLQFNSGGSFGAVSNLTWNGTTFAVVGDVTYTGTITDVSDMRLKNNILPLNDRGSMLGKLDQIGTYSFTMKDDQNGRVEFGVMAQEINKVFPELVKIDESTVEKYMSVNYVGLIAPLIEASKELKSENESLKAQISTIEERMASIEGDMNGMKAHTGYGISKAQMGLGMVLGMILMGGMAGVAMIVVNRRRRQG